MQEANGDLATMHMAWRASGQIVCRGSMTTTPESSSAHVIPVFANSLSRIACGRSHTMPVPADNTRIISIHSDMICVVNPDMISCCGLPNLRNLPLSFRIPTACTVRGTRGSPVFPAPGLLTWPSKSLCRLTVLSCGL